MLNTYQSVSALFVVNQRFEGLHSSMLRNIMMLPDEMPPRGGFIQAENKVLHGWFKVPPAVPLSPAVPFSTNLL